MVHVHELGFTEMAKAHVFRGSKTYTSSQIITQLGMGDANRNDPRKQNCNEVHARRFLATVEESEFALNSLLDELRKDRWPVGDEFQKRPYRSTGAALSVAISLLEAWLDTLLTN